MTAPSDKRSPIDIASQNAAYLAAAEVGIGSIFHALRFPLTGQALSLHQIFLLSRSCHKLAGHKEAKSIGYRISFIAALLKSLAPAGKKLTPMLAISMQGILFSMGTWFMGANALGMVIGASLSALWAYLQPALLMLIVFGSSLVDVANYFLEKTESSFGVTKDSLILVLAAMIGFKVICAWAMVGLAIFLPETSVERLQKKLTSVQPNSTPRQRGKDWPGPAILAFRDLFNPLFLISLVLTALFFIWAESNKSTLVWALLRPIAVGYIIFYLLRWLPRKLDWEKLRERSYFRPWAAPLESAYEQLLVFMPSLRKYPPKKET
jgi:hypothetical protein